MDEAKQPTVFDSDQQQVGEVYAQALIGFGQEHGGAEPLVEQLEAVSDLLVGMPQLRAMLESPGISGGEKLNLLDKSLAGRIDGHLLNFLKIILDKGRFDCVGAIASAARTLVDEMAGRVRATVTTAESVETAVSRQIQEKLEGKLGRSVQLVSVVDPSIIGGMVVRIGDTVYDGSIRNQLDRVRAKATKSAADAIRESLEKFIAG